MSKTIVVIGVTGIQGTSVAETFLSIPGWKIRGISRNPSSEAGKALAARGVEVVKGDLDDKTTLFPAFEGATVIFANTDFFNPIRAAIGSTSITGGRSAQQYAYDAELEQGLNIAEAAAAPATLETLTHFIYSTLSDATKGSKGKYTHIFHNDVKAKVTREIQSRFPKLAARMSTIHIGHYVTNWHVFPPAKPQKQPDGSYVIERPFSPDLKTPFIFAHKDTGPFVKALVDLAPGKNINAYAEELTWPEFTKVWADVLGVKAIYKQVSHEEHFAGVPDPLKDELSETFRWADEFGFTGEEGDFLTAEQLGVKVPVTSMAEYVKQEDWSTVL